MDIAKFNKELGTKIAMAKSYEKHDNSEVAIKLWIEISEMTINASKDPTIETPFRHMLITRTEQIFEHIRSLKTPKEVQFIEEEIIPTKEDIQIQEATEDTNDITPKSDVSQTDLPSPDLPIMAKNSLSCIVKSSPRVIFLESNALCRFFISIIVF